MKNTMQKSSEERALPIEKRGEIVSWFSALKHSWRTAYLIDNPSRHALPEIAPCTAKVDEALSLLTTAVREKRPATLPNLKEALRTLESSEKSGYRERSEVRTDLRFVISESKRILRSINTMQQLLSTKLAKDE